MVDPAEVQPGAQPEPPDRPCKNERDQAEQHRLGEEHPVQGVHHQEVRAEQWCNTDANTAEATDQAEMCRPKRDSAEHIGACQAVRAEQWSRATHIQCAADQAEQTTDVQQNTVEGEVATHTLDCQNVRAELCDNPAHTDCAGKQTGQSNLATDQPEHDSDPFLPDELVKIELSFLPVELVNLPTLFLPLELVNQVQSQAEQQCSPSVQQEGDKTKIIRQPLTTPRAAARSVVSPISIIIDPVLTSNSKGYFLTDDAMPVTSCV